MPSAPHRKFIPMVATLLLAVPFAAGADPDPAGAQAGEGGQVVVEEGSKVGIEYTMKLDDGQVVDTSDGREPLVYQQGAGQLLPSIEAELEGMSVGGEKQLTLTPEQGYGEIHEELYQEVPADRIPEGARHAGAQLISRDEQGHERPLRVHEVRDEVVVLDLNHPLAGQTLHFDVKVVSID